MALIPVTQQFIFLEDGDTAELTRAGIRIFDSEASLVERPIQTSVLAGDVTDRGGYRHYMLKEIFEQPSAIAETLEGRIHNGRILESAFGYRVSDIFDKVERVVIIACGTSYHGGARRPVTGSKAWRVSPVRSRLPASFATASP